MPAAQPNAGVEVTVEEYLRRLSQFVADALETDFGREVPFRLVILDIDGNGHVASAGTAMTAALDKRLQDYISPF